MSRTTIPDQMIEHLLPEGWVKEHRFHSVRRWCFDYAWPEYRVALEVEGGIWTKGRHTRGKGFANDIEKYDEAVILGWRVLRITRDNFNKGRAGQLIERALRIQP